jgi:uncharacterized protein (DUF433 family)
VVGLRTLALLRAKYGISLDEIRAVGAYLRGHASTLWSSVRFWVVNGHVAFSDPVSRQAVAGEAGQLVIDEIFLEPIAKQVEHESRAVRERSAESVGRVVRSRSVMSNQWVVAGTRIPTSIVKEYADQGFGADQIIAEYPDLNHDDVQAALAHEAKQRRDAA